MGLGPTAGRATSSRTLDLKTLGAADRKFSAKQIKEMYGAPKTVAQYATRENGKIVSYRTKSYPPIAFTIPVGGDQATLLTAPKRLWAGDGILENAKKALGTK